MVYFQPLSLAQSVILSSGTPPILTTVSLGKNGSDSSGMMQLWADLTISLSAAASSIWLLAL